MIHLIRQAQTRGYVPRVHGNGFVQLDLSETVRLHVWGHPSIPRQKTDTPIHDHRFAFSSLILKGAMTNNLYEMMAPRNVHAMKATHREHRAVVRDRQDTVLEFTGRYVHLAPRTAITYRPGDSYAMRIGEIHESIVHERTITVICKYGLTLAQGGAPPSVLSQWASSQTTSFIDIKPIQNCYGRSSMTK